MIESLRCGHIAALSPSHLPPYTPVLGNVERVMTKPRCPGLAFLRPLKTGKYNEKCTYYWSYRKKDQLTIITHKSYYLNIHKGCFRIRITQKFQNTNAPNNVWAKPSGH